MHASDRDRWGKTPGWVHRAAQFPVKPLLAACAIAQKEVGEWQAVGRAKGKLQAAGSRSTQASTCRGHKQFHYLCQFQGQFPDQLRIQKLKYEPSFEKATKLHQLKALKQEQCHFKRKSGPSSSTPSSPSAKQHAIAPPQWLNL